MNVLLSLLTAAFAFVPGAASGALNYADLSPMLSAVQNSSGLVAVGAFVASGDGLCAAGAAGGLWNAPDAPPVSLWDAPWHGGSLTKSMTSSLVALLVKDESVPLTWETRLGQLFPVEVGHTPYDNVTLAHLVSNRGGFPREVSPIASLEQLFPTEAAGTSYANVTVAQIVMHPGYSNELPPEESPPQALLDLTLVEQRRAIMLYGFNTDPVVPPILNGSYSNLGYVIAGALLENITGVAWEDLISERLFDKLGMHSAYFMCPNTTQSPLGHVYNNEAGRLEAIPSFSRCDCLDRLLSWCPCALPAVYSPAGGVYMPMLDYVKYYQWHLAGHRGEDTSGLLSAKEFQRLHTSMGIIGNGYPGSESKLLYGYGWLHIDHPFGTGKILHHDGTNNMWGAAVFIAPIENRVLFLATNSEATKSGEPPLGLRTILNNLILNFTMNDTACTPLSQLNVGLDPETPDECKELVYGDISTHSSRNNTSESPERNRAWARNAQVAHALLVVLMFILSLS